MRILTDLHCHTIASDHAFSTVMENVKAASEKGLEALAITDHGPAMEDGPHIDHFICQKGLPRELYGVRLLIGCEVNIRDIDGSVDIPDKIMKNMDIVIASIHNPLYRDFGTEDNTSTYLGVLNNPYVDIIGHSGNPKCRYDIDTVLTRAKELGKFIEINENTFRARPQSVEICREIALAAKRIGTGIVVNSDAHFATKVGEVQNSIEMLTDIDFPVELIVNRSLEALEKAMEKRKKFR